jgi:GT2 family glycosyltransferase/glycosyltransferase involved in cell wall biosynthesis
MDRAHFAANDISLLTPERNFGAGGDSRNVVDISSPYSDSTVIWQQSVYDFAHEVASVTGAKRVVDVGVGGGQKLLRTFQNFEADYLQVDWADNREKIVGQKQAPFFRANFEDPTDVDALRSHLQSDVPTLMIFSDVVEHLRDIRIIMRAFRRILRQNPNNRLIISTPDRGRVDGLNSEEIPDNPAHVRQWTTDEFRQMLESCGFKVENLDLVAQNQWDSFNRTIVAEISCDDAFYAHFLTANGLPQPSDHLIVTSEHSSALSTGGIGTYYHVAEEHSKNRRLVLYSGGGGLPDDGSWVAFARNSGWLHAADLCGRSNVSRGALSIDPDEVLNALQIVLFLYDEIRLIEYQDYMGIGYRIAQAKRAGMLPANIFVMAYAHGNHGYLDNAAGHVSKERPLSMDVKERLSVELADCVVFPTAFMRDLYLKTLGFKPRRHALQPYPADLHKVEIVDIEFGKINTIAFYGKPTPQKGYPEFCDAMVKLFTDRKYTHVARQIKNIVVLGTKTPDERLERLPNVTVSGNVYGRSDVVRRLHDLSENALVILPYKADNHPLSIFEVVDSKCQFVAFRAGGVPEQLPSELHSELLCEPNADSLLEAISTNVVLSFWDRVSLIRRTRDGVVEKYKRHSQDYLAMIESFKSEKQAPTGDEGDVDFIVTNYNGDPSHIEEAIFGISNSFKAPNQVIFVDDCSTPLNFAILEHASEKLLRSKAKIVRNATNLGLAGARNVGLQHVTAKYVCTHDNDDVLLNGFVSLACRILDENPEVDVVTCFDRAFNDGDDWRGERTITNDYVYRPVGMDFGLGLSENPFGPALAVFRTETLRQMGGWDDSSKGTWEDWQLFLKMAGLGKQIWVIPRVGFLYRVRQSSMLRTYPTFPGWMRIAKSIPGIPDNQRYSTIRSVLTPLDQFMTERATFFAQSGAMNTTISHMLSEKDALLGEIQRLNGELHQFHVLELSIAWRMVQKVRLAVNRHPRLKMILSAMLRRLRRS